MIEVVLYGTAVCPYCVQAKKLLENQNIPYEEHRVDIDPEKRVDMERMSGRRTVPQIFIGGRHVGGWSDLKALYERGELSAWLK